MRIHLSDVPRVRGISVAVHHHAVCVVTHQDLGQRVSSIRRMVDSLINTRTIVLR
jgi:hypothetical protein